MKSVIGMLSLMAIVASCSNYKDYTITGKVEGGADGDTVYLQKAEGRRLVKLDSAIIENGVFTFKGVQDTTAYRYVTYNAADKAGLTMDFFLENGKIDIELTTESDVAKGTVHNDAYQVIRNQNNDLAKQFNTLYNSIAAPELSDEQRKAKVAELEELNDKMVEIKKAGAEKNITNIVGVELLKQVQYYLNAEELNSLVQKVPAEFTSDAAIVRITENAKKMLATAEGQKFTDFELSTPDGAPIKLSDYAGKGKYVLVDFWASWCGPCRQDMPKLVELYAKYKDKNFEIVGVSLDRDGESWKKGIENLNITWPQMSDLKFWNCEGSQLYAVSSIPHTVLIDGEGTIVARGLNINKLTEKLAEVLE